MVMIAGAFQYETYAACRTKQAQNMMLEGYDGEFCYGIERHRKTPRGDAAPMRHIACIRGVMDNDASFLRYASLFEGLFAQVGSVYLDYRATRKGRDSADPRCADAALVPAPMPSARINHAIQIMLQEACGLSPEEAGKFTRHSPRHFLVKCAMARGELDEVLRELGRWCGSTLASNAMTPTSRKRSREDMQLNSSTWQHQRHSPGSPPPRASRYSPP